MERQPYAEEQALLVLHGLVRRRDLLRARGAGGDELRANQLDIERARWRLAGAVRRRLGPAAPRHVRAEAPFSPPSLSRSKG